MPNLFMFVAFSVSKTQPNNPKFLSVCLFFCMSVSPFPYLSIFACMDCLSLLRLDIQDGPNVTANLYCICLSEHEHALTQMQDRFAVI